MTITRCFDIKRRFHDTIHAEDDILHLCSFFIQLTQWFGITNLQQMLLLLLLSQQLKYIEST